MLNCKTCVLKERDEFNKKNPNSPAEWSWYTELEYRELEEKISECEERINKWRVNGNGTDDCLKRDFIASIVIYLLKRKPIFPLNYSDYLNLEEVKKSPVLLTQVAQIFEIEPKKLRKLL